MAEINPGDLKDHPSSYKSSRAVGDVLIGEDTAVGLIDASSVGDVTILQEILEQSPEVALESPHRIFYQERPAKDANDIRYVQAMKTPNLTLAITHAAENGHEAVVSTLVAFASKNGVKLSTVIKRDTIEKTIKNNHVGVFEVLAKAESSVATFDIGHNRRPLDLAIASGKVELAKVILAHGGAREFPTVHGKSTYPGGRLCQSAKSKSKTMTELLIQHGYAVEESGALHMAAAWGGLDNIRMLVEEHGADVNEQLPAKTVQRNDNAMYASWTPMHFAAGSRQEESMKLLEGYGAKTDVVDVNGRTPAQLLQHEKDIRQQKAQSSTE